MFNTRSTAIIAALALALPLHAFADGEPSAAPAQEKSAAPAKDKKPTLEKVSKSDEKLNPWTDCGLGAMIFDETKWAAVISNIIWDYGLTATTSAVSSRHTCEGKHVATAMFINETYDNVAAETAAGDGSHIAAMLNIRGCNSAAQQDILASIRTNFASNVSSAGYADKSTTEKAQDYYFMLENIIAEQYANQCEA